jgi:hypothetical protein
MQSDQGILKYRGDYEASFPIFPEIFPNYFLPAVDFIPLV